MATLLLPSQGGSPDQSEPIHCTALFPCSRERMLNFRSRPSHNISDNAKLGSYPLANGGRGIMQGCMYGVFVWNGVTPFEIPQDEMRGACTNVDWSVCHSCPKQIANMAAVAKALALITFPQKFQGPSSVGSSDRRQSLKGAPANNLNPAKPATAGGGQLAHRLPAQKHIAWHLSLLLRALYHHSGLLMSLILTAQP